MSNGLHVDAGSMNFQGRNTVTLSQDLGTQINNLVNNVESLMGIWSGIAANEFKTVVDQQVVNLRNFQDLLNLLGEKITQGARVFDETEEDNASRAANLF